MSFGAGSGNEDSEHHNENYQFNIIDNIRPKDICFFFGSDDSDFDESNINFQQEHVLLKFILKL